MSRFTTGALSARLMARDSELLAPLRGFRHIVQVYPRYAEANYDLGITLQQIGELDQAIGVLRAAANLAPLLTGSPESGNGVSQQQ